MPVAAACGSWKSPITTDQVAAGQVSLSEPRFDGPDLYWLEGRPSEGGRVSIVARFDGRTPIDVVGEPHNVRTRVHEYGGGAWTARGGTLFFSDFASGRLYRRDPDRARFAVTPVPAEPIVSVRYADLEVAPDGKSIACVRESHSASGEVANDLVLLPTDGSSEPVRLTGGRDFYSFPRFSPDGGRLLWTSWDHPRMPWDGTDLWVADLSGTAMLGPAAHVAGGPAESIFQPAWGPDGTMYFVSDRTGWWNLYSFERGRVTPILPAEAEFGVPQWVFGLSRYVLLEGARLAAIRTRNGFDDVLIVDLETGEARPWTLPYTSITSLAAGPGGLAAVLGASPSLPAEISVGRAGEEAPAVVVRSADLTVSGDCLSVPEHVGFPTGGGATAFAFFYPPKNEAYAPLEGEAPPLIVTSHGGPTSSAGSGLNLSIQFWTSRGFAVVDVDYRGSSGYGRAYRESLNGEWGEADVEDCVRVARWLAGTGRVDADRMAIRGKSASGLTTLAALVFYRDFAAGASYYGVADLEGLVRETHKFESRYLDTLVGPYPAAAGRYRSRSPLEHADRLGSPLILLQGLEDRVVPPSQAEAFVEALRRKGLPFAYVTFEGEQHGFRQASSIQRALEAELYFYSRIFGFTPSDAIAPLPIENAQGIRRREPNT